MEPYVGEIQIFAGTYAPEGWFLCNGQLLSIAEYQVLFSLIGTTYGGDGVQTFALPNLQGRAPMGVTGNYPIGTAVGTADVTLQAANIPAHSHTVAAKLKVSSSTADQKDPTGKYWAKTATGDNEYTNLAPNATLATNATSITLGNSVGGQTPVNNMQPFQSLNFIISWQGIYPTQA
jgi:microcystin-dependent protein